MKNIGFFLFYLVIVSCTPKIEVYHPTEKSNYNIVLNLDGCPGKTVYLSKLYADKNIKLDSAIVSFGKPIVWTFTNKNSIGVYQILIGNNEDFISFVFEKEDVSIHAKYPNIGATLKISDSEYSKILHETWKLQAHTQKRIQTLMNSFKIHKPDDVNYKQAENQYFELMDSIESHYLHIKQKFGNSFTSRFLFFTKELTPDYKLNDSSRIVYMRLHALDSVSFGDTSLMNSVAFPNKILEYLSYYRQSSFTSDEQENQFIAASEIIIEKCKKFPVVYDFAVRYILQGFEQLKLEKAITVLGQKYLPEMSCTNEQIKNDLEAKVKDYQMFTIGNIAPPLKFKTLENKMLDINQMTNDKLVIVFWASWCPHCKETLRTLKQMYEERKSNWEVIAISIDTEHEKHLNTIKEEKYNWIQSAEYKGWDGKAPKAFGIYATPTIFVLDKARKIISKPQNSKDLKAIDSLLN